MSEEPYCDGCARGLRTFRRGPNMETERWHWDGQAEFRCSGFFANWNMSASADYCSREMHANMVRGVEACFTRTEWAAASAEMHESGNSSWVGVVVIAVRNLRERSESAQSAVAIDPSATDPGTLTTRA
jgi:hypothetical protein